MRPAVTCLALVLAATVVACGDGSDALEGNLVGGETSEAFAEELAIRAERFPEAEYKAAYEMTVDSDEGQVEGLLSWYQQPGMVRGDFNGQWGEQKVDIVVIPGPGYPSEEFLYFCRRQDRSCIEARPKSEQEPYPEEAGIIVLASVLLAAEEFGEAAVITKTLERIIAGQEVLCFRGSGVAGAPFDSGEVCVTENGVVLSVTQEAVGKTISLLATVFSNEVDDDNFTPPYALIEGA